ncbi:hypothetical protein HNY73_008620 [Argiope bruennichi]|uniref:Uncharacterized protein n=1 Tax=Argiope bruennichi TaxID=94029 RepID=A0A8T0F750_ARGBR|nr:hypothetical protein HNY73_008620 [Argiope bruennichi]
MLRKLAYFKVEETIHRETKSYLRLILGVLQKYDIIMIHSLVICSSLSLPVVPTRALTHKSSAMDSFLIWAVGYKLNRHE